MAERLNSYKERCKIAICFIMSIDKDGIRKA